MIRRRFAFSSFPRRANVLPLDHAQGRLRSPLHPIDQGLSRPWTHEHGMEISLSTCTDHGRTCAVRSRARSVPAPLRTPWGTNLNLA